MEKEQLAARVIQYDGAALPACQALRDLAMFDWIRKNLMGRSPVVDPFEQFVREFVAECEQQNVRLKSYDPQARAFVVSRDDGSEMTCQLHNAFGEWQSRSEGGRAELIAMFVQSLVEMRSDNTISPEKLPGQLMPGIRSNAQISNMLIQNWIAGAPTDDRSATAFLPFAGDLVACAMQDLPHSMSQMTHVNLAFANLSIEQAMQHAMANFRSKLPQPVFEPLGDGLFGSNNLADHQSAMLLLAPGLDYPLPKIDGTPVAIVPTRNLFYLTGNASRSGLEKMLDIAQRAGQMPHFCSSAILQWDGHRWSEAPIAGGELAARQREIAQYQLAADYDSQKQLLDKYHGKCGLDIFVAQQMLFRKKDEPATISVATLASATTGTLLPHANRLSFVKQIVDPTTGLAQKAPEGMVDVPWSDAMDIVGDLFEPVAHLYPPRLRALGFPDADAWLRLKASAAASPAASKPSL
jgi:hypothetical protein